MNNRHRLLKKVKQREFNSLLNKVIQPKVSGITISDIKRNWQKFILYCQEVLSKIIKAFKNAVQELDKRIKELEGFSKDVRHQIIINGPSLQGAGAWQERSNHYLWNGNQVGGTSGIWQSQSGYAARQVGSCGISNY